jgi:hypothetical protein
MSRVWRDKITDELRSKQKAWLTVLGPVFGMGVLVLFALFTAVLLVVSLVVHASTFLIDTMTEWPGVMFIHLAIFPPFIAALCYASRTSTWYTGGKEPRNLDPAFHSAPGWLCTLTLVSFVYALVNFGVFAIVLTEGGRVHERDGKYFLQRGGNVLRELSEAEYHRQQAYVVRGFSGHWMLFACASLTLLVGAAKLRLRAAGAPDAMLAPVAGPREQRHSAQSTGIPEIDCHRGGHCLRDTVYLGLCGAGLPPAQRVRAKPGLLSGLFLVQFFTKSPVTRWGRGVCVYASAMQPIRGAARVDGDGKKTETPSPERNEPTLKDSPSSVYVLSCHFGGVSW